MASNYPASYDDFTNPLPSDRQSSEVGGRTHSEMHGDANDAIERIEQELGLNPSGDYATVAARLDDPHKSAHSLQFDLAAAEAAAEGKLTWNATDGTLDLGLRGGNVTLQIGQEQVTRVKAADNGGLVEGRAVYVVGSDGANKTVGYAQADSEATSAVTLGVMTESVNGGQTAFCTTFGLVRGIDTSALAVGQAVWLSATVPGGLTTTKPGNGFHLVQIGFCIRQHATNGAIFVKVENGYELDELHDTNITAPAHGDVLAYDSASGVWRNQPPAAVQNTSYVHTQNNPSTVWTVNHGLGFYPQATVLEFGGANVEGEIEYQSANQLTLTFTVSIAGTAYIS